MAGIDMEMSMAPNAFATLAESVRAGRVSEERLNEAVRRVLVAKIRMGLFENPYVDGDAAERVLNDPAHAEATQAAAERALVLLKNDGGALPLAPGAHKRVAVIGPLADSAKDTNVSLAFPARRGECSDGVSRRPRAVGGDRYGGDGARRAARAARPFAACRLGQGAAALVGRRGRQRIPKGR